MSKSRFRAFARPLGVRLVGEPTTEILGEVPRFDERENGFQRAGRGDFGPRLKVLGGVGGFWGRKTPLGRVLIDSSHILLPYYDGPVAETRVEVDDPAKMSWRIKKLAKFLRADLVGVCKMEPYTYYSHRHDGKPIEASHKYGIVVAVDQGLETFRASTGFDEISNSQSFVSYTHSGYIVIQIASYIRSLGYSAKAHWFSRYEVLPTPMLLMAGLGEMGRVGLVVTPELGIRFKASAVTTDLPLEPDKPIDFGLQAFCEVCKKCAENCPSGAIPTGEKTVRRNYKTWHIDVEKCTKFRIANHPGSACGRCIKVCPYSSKPLSWWHKLGIWVTSRIPAFNPLMVKLDDALGFGLSDLPEEKWWKGYNESAPLPKQVELEPSP